MKAKLFLGMCSAWLWLHTTAASAGSLPSPDGRYTLITQPIVRVVDASGATVLVLDKDPRGVRHIESSWSPDGRRVVVAEDFDRGSAVFGAWRQGNAWHRAVQPDADGERFVQGLERQGLGGLKAEHAWLSEWVSADAIGIRGELIFGNGQRVPYAYTLRFVADSGPLSRGGYELGVLKGTGYRITER
jgi:hypothetical protein